MRTSKSRATKRVYGRTTNSRECTVGELRKKLVGLVAYIKPMTSREAETAYPTIEGLPKDSQLFLLCDADGTARALTDSEASAIGYARDQDLSVLRLN
jgi:hypothetical protein